MWPCPNKDAVKMANYGTVNNLQESLKSRKASKVESDIFSIYKLRNSSTYIAKVLDTVCAGLTVWLTDCDGHVTRVMWFAHGISHFSIAQVHRDLRAQCWLKPPLASIIIHLPLHPMVPPSTALLSSYFSLSRSYVSLPSEGVVKTPLPHSAEWNWMVSIWGLSRLFSRFDDKIFILFRLFTFLVVIRSY